MNKKRKRRGGKSWQQMSTVSAVLISAVLGLLGGLLGNVVANLINVPAGWEWLPIVALTVVFIMSLPITVWLARKSEQETKERGSEGKDKVTIEQVDMDNSEMSRIHSSGQVVVKDAKLKDSEITDIEAG